MVILSYKKLTKSAKDMLVLTGIFTFISSSLFPWFLFEKTFLNTIQFPWRFFILITLCLTWIIPSNFELLFTKKFTYIALILFTLLISFTSIINLQKKVHYEKNGFFQPYAEFNKVITTSIGGAEYLNGHVVDIEQLKEMEPIPLYNKEKLLISQYEKVRGRITFDYKSSGKNSIVLPLIYYRGYDVTYKGSGTPPHIIQDIEKGGLIALDLEGEGSVIVDYHKTKIQLMSLWLSIISWLGLLVYCFWSKFKKQKNI